MSSPDRLRQISRSLITLTEAQTGKQVVVQDEPTLSTFATVAMARGGSPAHVIRYRPMPDESPDYLICYQCGFVLRKFSVPESDRVDFASAAIGKQITTSLVTQSLGKKGGLDPDRVKAVAKQILDGLLIHLLSIPVGLRVGQWLREEYPDLRPLQERQVFRELKVNEQSSSPQTKRMIPKKIFDCSQAINAAFALFWADVLGQPEISSPFSAYRRDGAALLEIMRDISPDPEHDRDLIDAWADHLHLAGWYQWVPFQA